MQVWHRETKSWQLFVRNPKDVQLYSHTNCFYQTPFVCWSWNYTALWTMKHSRELWLMIVCEKMYPRSVRDHGQLIKEMCLEFLGVLLVFVFLRFDTENLCHFLLPVTPVSWLCTKEKDMPPEVPVPVRRKHWCINCPTRSCLYSEAFWHQSLIDYLSARTLIPMHLLSGRCSRLETCEFLEVLSA